MELDDGRLSVFSLYNFRIFYSKPYYFCNLKINYILKEKLLLLNILVLPDIFFSLQIVFLPEYDNTVFLNPSIFLNILL